MAPIVHELGRLGTELRRLGDTLSERDDSTNAPRIAEVLENILAVVRQLQ